MGNAERITVSTVIIRCVDTGAAIRHPTVEEYADYTAGWGKWHNGAAYGNRYALEAYRRVWMSSEVR